MSSARNPFPQALEMPVGHFSPFHIVDHQSMGKSHAADFVRKKPVSMSTRDILIINAPIVQNLFN
jgi:hypothetical protein